MITSLVLSGSVAVLAGAMGRYFGTRGTALLCTIGQALALLYLVVNVLPYLKTQEASLLVTEWFQIGNLQSNWSFSTTSLSVTMSIVVLSISTVVHTYSLFYLGNDPHSSRFYSFLSLFTFCMLILVTSTNLLQIFVGWEGVGLLSYLLIGYWFTRQAASKAALKALFVNKIGDICFLFGVGLCYQATGCFDLVAVATILPVLTDTHSTLMYYAAIGFCFAAFAKSAQIGFHIWLPDAMEGPTPVSALLHAATMVTAGVFLMLRLDFILEFFPSIALLVVTVGATTAFFGATIGCFQYDLKRIIAFSTCSQLGYMLAACGFGFFTPSFYHLYNHAFFKALLFLAAGTVIHALINEQDIRKMGGLAAFLPVTCTFFVLASMSLMAVPFLSGFYSKELVLHLIISEPLSQLKIYSFCLLVGGAFCTSYYSTRLLYFVFFCRPNFFRSAASTLHEAPRAIQLVLASLAGLGVFSGWTVSVAFSPVLDVLSFVTGSQVDFDYTGQGLLVLPLLVTVVGIWFALLVVTRPPKAIGVPRRYCLMFFNQKWFFDWLILRVALRFYSACFTFLQVADRGLLEAWFGGDGLTLRGLQVARVLQRNQAGNLAVYFRIIFCIVFGSLLILAWWCGVR